jgi:hypothetical protein
LKIFIKVNKEYFINKKILTSVFRFNLEHKLDYNNKFSIINGLYIPNCYIDPKIPIDNEIIRSIIYKEITYPTPDRIDKMIYIFNKYKNVEQLMNHLSIANVSVNDFNKMMQSIKPLGFKNKEQYRKLVLDVARIAKTKFKNFTIKFLGSSTTFYSANHMPEKLEKFFSYENSDIDINIIPNENFDDYKKQLNISSDINNYIISIGVYVNPLVRDFFGETIMKKFFNKWGPQELEPWPSDIYEQVDINKTIMKRHISITLSTKQDMFQHYDIIKDNKTCFSNFSTYVRDGKTISYWNEHNEYITKTL